MTTKQSFARTAMALQAYDLTQTVRDKMLESARTNADVVAWEKVESGAKRNVCVAFHQDTADINSLENCLLCDPGPKDPPAGTERSFIRRTVAEWMAAP